MRHFAAAHLPAAGPEARFSVAPGEFTTAAGPGGIMHFSLDLDSRIDLSANDPANPRWFVGFIGLTHQAYVTFDRSQGTGGSSRTFQFIRGGFGGYAFRSLADGRALVIGGVPEPAAALVLLSGSCLLVLQRSHRSRFP